MSESRTHRGRITPNSSIGPHIVSNNHDNFTPNSSSDSCVSKAYPGRCRRPEGMQFAVAVSLEWLNHTAAHSDDV